MTPNVHRNQLSTLILVLEVLGEKVKIYTFLGKIIKTFLYNNICYQLLRNFKEQIFPFKQILQKIPTQTAQFKHIILPCKHLFKISSPTS